MNKAFEKHFIDTYPKIFKDMYGPLAETCLHFGITCGDGWFVLLDELCKNLQTHIDSYNNSTKDVEYHKPQVIALQVKEKFGRLCFYFTGGDGYCDGLVRMAESMSGNICEECGTSGLGIGRPTTGWIQSLCWECAYKKGKSIKCNKIYEELVVKSQSQVFDTEEFKRFLRDEIDADLFDQLSESEGISEKDKTLAENARDKIVNKNKSILNDLKAEK